MPLLYTKLQRKFGTPKDGLTRREMLQATLAASAGLLLSGSGMAAQARAGKRVIVVGAGFSGHGFKFVPEIGRRLAAMALDGEPSLPPFSLAAHAAT